MRVLCIGDNDSSFYRWMGIMFPGGNCPNVAAYCRLNGHESGYIGVIAADRVGNHFLSALQSLKVDVSRIRVCEGMTTFTDVTLNNADRVFGEYRNDIQKSNPIHLGEDDLAYIRSFDLAHSSIYSVLDGNVLPRLKESGIGVSYDFSDSWTGRDIETICPNLSYAFFSCGHLDQKQTKLTLVEAVRHGAAVAVGTRGVGGAHLFDGRRLYYQKAYPADAVDTIGAGDAFIARFLLSYEEGRKIREKCDGPHAERSAFRQEDLDENRSVLTRCAMSQAALFAAGVCRHYGPIGMGMKMDMK